MIQQGGRRSECKNTDYNQRRGMHLHSSVYQVGGDRLRGPTANAIKIPDYFFRYPLHHVALVGTNHPFLAVSATASIREIDKLIQ